MRREAEGAFIGAEEEGQVSGTPGWFWGRFRVLGGWMFWVGLSPETRQLQAKRPEASLQQSEVLVSKNKPWLEDTAAAWHLKIPDPFLRNRGNGSQVDLLQFQLTPEYRAHSPWTKWRLRRVKDFATIITVATQGQVLGSILWTVAWN